MPVGIGFVTASQRFFVFVCLSVLPCIEKTHKDFFHFGFNIILRIPEYSLEAKFHC
jgi:hypothetical protein